MAAPKDITGQRFGRLTVTRREGSTPQGIATWCCLCDCGRSCIVEGAKLRKGNTQSCGCLHDEIAKKRLTAHGKSRSRLCGVWKAMKQRCCNPSNKNYSRYGERGITVCNEWMQDFQAFYNWAIENGYDENAATGRCTIDRIDNDKGYSPDNCRFVTIQEQQRNKSNYQRGAKRNERNQAYQP